MKRKLIVLLTIVVGLLAAHVVPASAYDNNTPTASIANGDLGNPYYGGALDSWAQRWNAHDGANAIIDAQVGTSADYTDHPTSWAYPTPGIGGNWLETRLYVQYDDNADGVPDGFCHPSTADWDWSTINAIGSYSASQSRTLPEANCHHLSIRVWVQNLYQPGGLGVWRTYNLINPGFFTNVGYYCTLHPTQTPDCA